MEGDFLCASVQQHQSMSWIWNPPFNAFGTVRAMGHVFPHGWPSMHEICCFHCWTAPVVTLVALQTMFYHYC